MNIFYEQVYDLVGQIPYGKVVTYGQIAWALNRPRSAREVGRAMRCCDRDIPCHRVVMADGTVSGGMFADIRKALLKDEGVSFTAGGRVDMKNCVWNIGGPR